MILTSNQGKRRARQKEEPRSSIATTHGMLSPHTRRRGKSARTAALSTIHPSVSQLWALVVEHHGAAACGLSLDERCGQRMTKRDDAKQKQQHAQGKLPKDQEDAFRKMTYIHRTESTCSCSHELDMGILRSASENLDKLWTLNVASNCQRRVYLSKLYRMHTDKQRCTPYLVACPVGKSGFPSWMSGV
jgi:hypothetical protein